MTAVTASETMKLGYAEYARIPDDGRRHEIIDGAHFVNPAPGTYHQTLSKRLQYQLYSQIELRGLGLIFSAPIDVQLSDHDIVQPDLLVILNARRSIVTPTKILGAPDLIVEILSPSNFDYDLNLKRRLYERREVPEYWIVDPVARAVQQLVLREGRFQLEPAVEVLRPTIAPDVAIPLREIW